jgi:Tol biopolymer transport system component
LAITAVVLGCEPQGQPERGVEFPVLTGPYLGQQPPGAEPVLFAPGIVSTGMYTRDVAMTPDGREIYFGVSVGGLSVIMQTRLEAEGWTRPEVAPFSANPDFMNLEPFVSPDGQKFYFLSTRPRDGGPMPTEDIGRWVNQDIWVMDRTAGGWGEPYNLGPPVNSDDEEYFPSVTRDGTIYFTRTPAGTRESYIYRARLVDGRYDEPERLGPEINSTASQFNAFIAPDESYLIVCVFGHEDSMGGTDYYIVFRDESDVWSRPINMGDAINTPRNGEFSPYVSPDGEYFFFMSTRPRPREQIPDRLTYDALSEIYEGPQNGNPDIYWVRARFIDELRVVARAGSAE